MKQLLLLSFLSLFLCSCASKIIPVKGEYAILPVTFKSEKTVDQVWDKLVDVFAQNGLSIKLIDRSSGLIVSENSLVTVTWENKENKPVHPGAYVVVPKYFNKGLNTYMGITLSAPTRSALKKPDPIRGEWNVRIKAMEGGTSINVNLVNVQYETLQYKTTTLKPLTLYKSTGLFEKMVADYIK